MNPQEKSRLPLRAILAKLLMPAAVACSLATGIIAPAAKAPAADLVTLNAENWDEYAPHGKEVDCIYGDYVLRNDRIVLVVGRPVAGRNANMTVKAVGGCVIDLTTRGNQNDQLSAYFPGGSRFNFTKVAGVRAAADEQPLAATADPKLQGKKVVLECDADAAEGKPAVTVRYTLEDGQPFVVVETVLKNGGAAALSEDLADAIRADKVFDFGSDGATKAFWAHDEWFKQAYAVTLDGYEIKRDKLLSLVRDGSSTLKLAPGESTTIRRRMFVADHLPGVLGTVLRTSGGAVRPLEFEVRDPAGPVVHAKVTLSRGKTVYGSGRTDAVGRFTCDLPEGEFTATIEGQGRPSATQTIAAAGAVTTTINLEACGYVVAEISDAAGKPIPCKVAFFDKSQAARFPLGADKKYSPTLAKPYFGPEPGEVAVHNLYYSHTGRFRQEMPPGKYDVLISYGLEYDVVSAELEVPKGGETKLVARLKRTVDTTGWVSSDFHSHSTPSGDNVSSQLGRVLNLLCEHIEFAPCTEHNRVDTYVPLLKRLQVEQLMATCSGMELTGAPLPVDHQNAFPLVLKPRTQDGGGPQTDINPVVQIERLAFWDNKSDKLVQENHPDLWQIWGDKDLDGKPDGGFRKMLDFADVVEIHPLDVIFAPPPKDRVKDKRGPATFHWLQLLNKGYRIPGVVNTDAHYNFHGSGWLRNYLRSSTDDPAKIQTMEMVHAAEKGNLMMTNGPFLEAELAADELPSPRAAGRGGPGDSVLAKGGKAQLRIRVQCANWVDVNRVQVFVNGRPLPELNFTRRTHPDQFNDGPLRFSMHLPLELKTDAHIVVATIGEGLTLGVVYGPMFGKGVPCAVANPIFVDVDGNGFKANGDELDVPLPTGP
ncbi:MAG TPA: CehA/McbA family metallohydrolase [Pirellulaceae bacterium]|nr:CehA/McbA family metallohydrolase [Pirellulaceae bacterium]